MLDMLRAMSDLGVPLGPLGEPRTTWSTTSGKLHLQQDCPYFPPSAIPCQRTLALLTPHQVCTSCLNAFPAFGSADGVWLDSGSWLVRLVRSVTQLPTPDPAVPTEPDVAPTLWWLDAQLRRVELGLLPHPDEHLEWGREQVAPLVEAALTARGYLRAGLLSEQALRALAPEPVTITAQLATLCREGAGPDALLPALGRETSAGVFNVMWNAMTAAYQRSTCTIRQARDAGFAAGLEITCAADSRALVEPLSGRPRDLAAFLAGPAQTVEEFVVAVWRDAVTPELEAISEAMAAVLTEAVESARRSPSVLMLFTFNLNHDSQSWGAAVQLIMGSDLVRLDYHLTGLLWFVAFAPEALVDPVRRATRDGHAGVSLRAVAPIVAGDTPEIVTTAGLLAAHSDADLRADHTWAEYLSLARASHA